MTLLLAAVALVATVGANGEPAAIPAPLEPWVDWVLEDDDERACSLDGAGAGERVCAWPGVLRLDLDTDGGQFEQEWTLQAEHWVPLPGGIGQWPQQVSIDGEPAAVVERDGRPSVRVDPGERRISGRFAWPRRPDVLKLPPEIALISLRLDGAPVSPLRFDQGRGDQGRGERRGGLWLGGQPPRPQTGEAERLSLEVARRIEDGVPLRVQTRLMLDVAGPPREVLLGPVLLPGGIPLRLESPLPARLVRSEERARGRSRAGADGGAPTRSGTGVPTGAATVPETASEPAPDPAAAPAGAARADEPTAQPEPDAAEPAFLQVQVRPGRWLLGIETHHPGPVDALRLSESESVPESVPEPAPRADWPKQEVWVFAARPDLRQVTLHGGQPIDPRQARIPEDWRQLPTLLMRPGETLRLEQQRRGAAGSDRVRLHRTLRLDFDGAGFSVRDRLSGRLEVRSRLEAEPSMALGQVRVDDEPRLITRLPEPDAPEGVEVRPGPLAMTADARLETGPIAIPQTLPASGWALPLAEASAELLLPPGWDLLAVSGVDNLPDSWLGRWTLLDIFLVLVAALAVARIWGAGWGLLALATLVLTWQEPGAPRWAWLHLILAAALLRALRAQRSAKTDDAPRPRGPGWLLSLVQVYFGAAVLSLAVIAVPFLVTEMRDGLFPQLDRQGAGLFGLVMLRDATMASAPSRPSGAVRTDRSELDLLADAVQPQVSALGGAAPSSLPAASPRPKRLPTLDPNAQVQTGPGVPDWTWRRYPLGWTGPLAAGQQLALWLLPPAGSLVLALLALLLVPLLALRLADRLPRRSGDAARPMLGLAVLACGAWLAVQPGLGNAAAAAAAGETAAAQDGGFPPPALLDALKQRLLKPADCVPRCAEIARMQLMVAGDQLQLVLAVDAAASVALPVPGRRGGWMPTLIRLNGEPWQRLRRSGDALWLPLPAGRHLLQLSGPLPASDAVVLPLPLRPRLVDARLAKPWQLNGLKANGVPGDQLELSRTPAAGRADAVDAATGAGSGRESDRFPPLLRIIRTLRFGLDWQVETRVERLSPADGPASLSLELIEGESVTTDAVRANAEGALIALGPRQRALRWNSTLEAVDRLTLSASEAPRFSEEWRLAVSPLWHLEADGVPPVQATQAETERLRVYRPWAGEQLTLRVWRPVGVPGPQLTLDRSLYRVTPGRRWTEAQLELVVRSTRGGRHPLRLPDGAELTLFEVDGRSRPLSLQAPMLDLPLVPGVQQIEIGWRTPDGLAWRYRPAVLDLGIAGVNAETQVRLPDDRWVLWTSGPGIGAAVQFWALLIALAVLAWLLARSRQTPLGFVDWLLLAVGLSQVPAWMGALVVLWLFALGWRRRLGEDVQPWRFNLAQIGLVLLSIAALIALLAALEQGLLGAPAMQIAGNGSTASRLQWYLDRQPGETAAVTLVSAPIWAYRLLMLAWALWLAWRLTGWLRWGWNNLMSPVPWRPTRRQQLKRQVANENLSVDL
ncbi:hypothetical protein CKO40_05925 [Halochromatium glycolicum]|uniref:Uncharacterized protein n=1 Tax=Halochromatium glycolicum TaxID=85075 RepID=A0AAJ0U2I1_9GAMM|nr:hypothetical protein [Halochromatium glycolicum]